MIHINRFLDKLKAFETKQAKDFVMPMRDAKDLHADITKLLIAVVELQKQQTKTEEEQIVKVEINGGDF